MMQKNSPKNEGGDPRPIAEAVLAKKLGVDPTSLIDTRNGALTIDQDFYEKAGRIYYHPSGVAKMLAALGLPPAVAVEVAQERVTGDVQAFVVLKRVQLNVRLLVAVPAGDESAPEIRIRVRNNRLFAVGELVRATPPPEGSAHWIIACRASRRRQAHHRNV